MVIARPSARQELRVLVIGGGASGVLLAAQLLRQGRGHVAVTILEKRALLGCGIAYSTNDPQHVLNTRVANMSAYPDLPDHFLDWLRTKEACLADPQGFVPRQVYGRYMETLLDPWKGIPALSCEQAECVALDLSPYGVIGHLAGGVSIAADVAVLATGHALPDSKGSPGLSQPWDVPDVPADGEVPMVGSGLTMVDQVLSLLARGHQGRITAVSRRGLLPQVHRRTAPTDIRGGDLPLPLRIATLMAWLRRKARAQEGQGGDWRDVVDGLRPHLQAIWRDLPPASRGSFLRHASAYWEAHRHRMPPASHHRLLDAQQEGRFRLLRGGFKSVEVQADGTLLACLTRPAGDIELLPVARVIDCRGVRRDPETHGTPLVSHLLSIGAARIDPLRLGLDIAPDCGVRDARGATSGRLFALGPVSRAAFWEITAIPDIRSQAATLSETILSAPAATCQPGDSRGAQPSHAATRSIGSTASKKVRSPSGEDHSPSPAPHSRGLLPKAASLEWRAPRTCP